MKQNIGKVGLVLLLLLLTGCGGTAAQTTAESSLSWKELIFDRTMELTYAKKFSVQYTAEGYADIAIAEEGEYLVVPEGKAVPKDLPEGMTVIQQPLQNGYLAATSAMDFFCALDGLDALRFSGTKEDGWYLPEAKEAMQIGDIQYAGKYNAPDYEQIVEQGCDLAIESTMIYHTPEVKENLESFGIPVLVDRSSYEPHPLGRTEWVKLYGVLLGKEELAEALLAEQTASLDALAEAEQTEKRVGFFYVSSRGYVNVRKSGDYVSKMIALAGGKYLFDDLGEGESALSTMNMQMEDFYAAAKDADILIYNSTIDGELESLEMLLEKCPLLAHCKAVQEGNVWCTTQNLFQETMSLGDMIREFGAVIHGEDTQKVQYLYRLQ